MATGKVLTLYLTLEDFLKAGHRMRVDNLECDPEGIIGDMNYEDEDKNMLLLVSTHSYDIIEKEELVVEKGVLMENIYTDLDINHLNKGSLIEIGEIIFEVIGRCQAFNYLYAFSPELPELLKDTRGIYLRATEYGQIKLDDEVTILKEA
jgi:MOSC domain-containing protein YiiM